MLRLFYKSCLKVFKSGKERESFVELMFDVNIVLLACVRRESVYMLFVSLSSILFSFENVTNRFGVFSWWLLHSCHCFVYITFMSDRFLCIADICCGSFYLRYLFVILSFKNIGCLWKRLLFNQRRPIRDVVMKNNLMSSIKIGGFLIFGKVKTSEYFVSLITGNVLFCRSGWR